MPVRKARKVTTLATIPPGSRRKKGGVLPSSQSNGGQPALIPVASPLDSAARRDLFREISVNRHRTLGLVPERLYNPDELAGRRGLGIYARMLTDDQVKAALTLKQHAVLSPGWDVEPASDSPQDLEVAEFVKFALEDLEGSLDDDLLEVLSSLSFGFSLSEIVYRPITNSQYQGKIGLRALKTRLPHDFVFVVDSHDNLLEDGIEQFGKRMPAAKFVIHSANKLFDNWYGTSDLRAAYRCYSDDTRVLTKGGWKFFQDVRTEDELASLDPVTGRMEYRRPTKVFHYWHKGKMFHQGGRFIDLLVTPNHRMWLAKGHRHPRKFGFVEAQDAPKIVRYKRDAEWLGEEREWFELPAITVRQQMSNHTGGDFGTRQKTLLPVTIRMDAWLRFFGVWIAEGWTTKTRQSVVGLCQNEGPKARMIATWIAACGFHAGERTTPEGLVRFEITNKQLYEYLVQFGKSHDKFIPRDLLELSSRQLRILYDAMMLGDGSRHGYATVSDRLADDVMEMILKTGGAPSKRKDVSESRFGPTGAVWNIHRNIRNVGATVCNLHFDQRSYVDYVGDVWCVEVPPHHLIYVERNGKACWSGNSWWFKENVLKWWAMFMDRYGIPLAEGIVPRGGALGDDAVTGLRTVLDNLQAATSIVHPDDITLQFPAIASATGSQIFVAAINAADQAIARALLLPNLLGVSAPADTGSFSQARKHFDVFILVVEKLQRDLADHVMGDQVIRRLVDLNYMVEDYPAFTFLPFTETDKGQLLSLWYQAIAAGAVQTRPEDEVHVRSITGFPEVPLEELEAEAEAKAAQEQAGGGFPGGLGGLGGGELGGEGGFPPGEGGSPGLGAPGGPSGEELGGDGGETPSDEELDALIDEVLGSSSGKERSVVTGGVTNGGRAGHRLAGRVAEALKGKGVKGYEFEESEHPREPSGSEAGGQFAPAGGESTGSVYLHRELIEKEERRRAVVAQRNAEERMGHRLPHDSPKRKRLFDLVDALDREAQDLDREIKPLRTRVKAEGGHPKKGEFKEVLERAQAGGASRSRVFRVPDDSGAGEVEVRHVKGMARQGVAGISTVTYRPVKGNGWSRQFRGVAAPDQAWRFASDVFGVALGEGRRVFAAFDEADVDSEGRGDEISAILEQLEADHPDWDDDALVEAAVAELEGGSDEEGDGELTDADLDGLLDEVLGGQDQQADGVNEGPIEEDAVAVLAVDEAELDRLIAEALAQRGDQASDTQGHDTPGLAELVGAVVAEHPDWGAEQVKAEVLNRVRVTEVEEGA